MDAIFQTLVSDDNMFFLDLYTSASIGCEERVRDIVDNAETKQILNKQNKSAWTPLMYAACSANLKVLLFLLEEGALPDIKNNLGNTALVLASKSGSTDAVSLLIDFRANVNIRDNKGWTAVFHAAAFGHRSVMQLLIEKGAQVDIIDTEEGLNPLMISAAAGHEIIVRDLLLLGLNPMLESKSGDTARSLAIKYGHQNVKNLIDTFSCSKKNYSTAGLKNSLLPAQPDLLSLLKELQLSKYYPIFENQGIDLNTFWMLSEEDIKELGINLFGPRKKICLAIAKHQKNYTNSNSENKDSSNKLGSENKKLLQQIDKLEKELSYEMECKKRAEKKLNDGIMTLRNFADNVQRTMHYTMVLSEKLRQNHSSLKQFLHFTSDLNNEKIKRDIIFPLLDGSEKLLEDIHHHVLLSMQQTDFRH